MIAEDSRWAIGRHRFFKGATYNLLLAASANRENQLWHTKKGGYRECQSLFRAFFKTLESIFSELLRPAHFVESNYIHCLGVVEVGFCGIVECQVSIFTNSEKAELRLVKIQLTSIFAGK